MKKRKIERKVQQINNSLMISIPSTYAMDNDINKGDTLSVSTKNGKIIYEKEEQA